jgi:hypothetical protein
MKNDSDQSQNIKTRTARQFTVDDMLENMACACQERKLLESYVQGAILRSIIQYMELNPNMSIDEVVYEFKRHESWWS